MPLVGISMNTINENNHMGLAMWRQLLGAALLVLANTTLAGVNDVLVDKVWMRESVPGQDAASLQLNLTSMKPATLIDVTSPVAAAIKIQRLSRGTGKVKATTLPSLRLLSRQATSFGKGNYALMMVGLKRPLIVGDRVPIRLTVRFGDQRIHVIKAEAEVKALDLSYKHYQEREVYDHR